MSQPADPYLRQLAFRKVVSQYNLANPEMQAGLIKLLNRETTDPNWEALDEEQWYEQYYSDIGDEVLRVARDYRNEDAWHAVLYSTYNEDSPFAKELAADPAAFPKILIMANDPRSYYAGRGLRLLAQALAHCSAPKIPDCSSVLARRDQILLLIRNSLSSKIEEITSDAIIALGICGTPQDIDLLKARSQKFGLEPIANDQAKNVRDAAQWLINDSIKKIISRESARQ